MSALPVLDGVITADEVHDTATHLASLQLDTGMIPWFVGGHCDPWNHVESAMALDVAGHHTEAERAYEWLVDTQLPNGGWYAYYANDGSIEDHKIDTNVCAYIGTGVYHHYRSTWDRGFAENLWPFCLPFCRTPGTGDRVPETGHRIPFPSHNWPGSRSCSPPAPRSTIAMKSWPRSARVGWGRCIARGACAWAMKWR